MNKPRIFLGSSGKQAKLLQAITRGLEDVADVEPWTATFGGGPPSTGSSILHAHGSKLPARPAAGPAEVRAINQKLRKAIETEGRRGQVEGCGGSSR